MTEIFYLCSNNKIYNNNKSKVIYNISNNYNKLSNYGNLGNVVFDLTFQR